AGAKIGGDCKLLFHRSNGPHIKAERIQVGGALAIGPNGGFEATAFNSYQKLIESGRQEIANIRHIASFGAERWNEFRFGKPPLTFKNPEAEKSSNKESSNQKKNYQIDLGNARSTFLHHPWQAWPATGHLIISGLQYSRALEFGPLSPNPSPEKSDSAFKCEADRGSRVTLGLFLVSFLLFLCWIVMFFIHFDTLRQAEVFGSFLYFLSAGVYRHVRAKTSPNKFQARPMALEWLKLQLVERNAYRSNLRLFGWAYQLWNKSGDQTKYQPILLPSDVEKQNRGRQYTGQVYHSLEPYAVAVTALRESGRWISANLVEEERLRVRDDQLSWRNHLIQKSLFWLIQRLNN
ncbi:MAG: hypothetical protein ACK5QX_01035, partial [bacterium]